MEEVGILGYDWDDFPLGVVALLRLRTNHPDAKHCDILETYDGVIVVSCQLPDRRISAKGMDPAAVPHRTVAVAVEKAHHILTAAVDVEEHRTAVAAGCSIALGPN